MAPALISWKQNGPHLRPLLRTHPTTANAPLQPKANNRGLRCNCWVTMKPKVLDNDVMELEWRPGQPQHSFTLPRRSADTKLIPSAPALRQAPVASRSSPCNANALPCHMRMLRLQPLAPAWVAPPAPPPPPLLRALPPGVPPPQQAQQPLPRPRAGGGWPPRCALPERPQRPRPPPLRPSRPRRRPRLTLPLPRAALPCASAARPRACRRGAPPTPRSPSAQTCRRGRPVQSPGRGRQ